MTVKAEIMKELYNHGKLKSVIPLWVVDKRKLKSRVDFKNYTIIKDFAIEILFKIMEGRNLEILLKKKLFHDDKGRIRDLKTYKVVDYWSDGQCLDPPTIFINKKKLDIEDGLHRFNAAYYFGATSIPIIISKIDFEVMESFL